MFERVLSKRAIEVIDKIAPAVSNFYLAGGTGLSLQLGHRKSLDFDFFSEKKFNISDLLKKIPNEKILSSQEGTLHCEIKSIKFSFLFYKQPLIFPVIHWRNIEVANWKDIVAEKIKTISQRGSKKDFYDLYAVIKLKSSIKEVCKIFRKKFSSKNINLYHVLKSIIYFEDAEIDPPPILLEKGGGWQWSNIKEFFIENINEFEMGLI